MPQKKTPTRHTTAAPKSVTKMTEATKAVIAAPAVTVAPIAAPVAAAKPTPAVVVPAAAAPAVAAAPVVAPFPAEQVAKLRDGAVEVAVIATEMLAKTGDARAIAPLISVLENADGYCHVVTRAAAAMALGQFDDAKMNASAVAALIVAAKDSMAEVSREAVLSLGDLKAASAVDTLVEIAGNASGFYLNVVRHAAVRSLGRMKAAAAKPVLSAITESTGEDAAIVAAAREALASL